MHGIVRFKVNCVVIVNLDIALSRTVRFQVGICSVARFKTALSYFQFLKKGDFITILRQRFLR